MARTRADDGPVRLTPLDVRIMQCLMEDARTPVLKMAEKLGLPESTLRSRLNRLTQAGVLTFVAETDPMKLGYGMWVMIGLSVDLTEIDTVAHKLAEQPEVYFVSATTGGHDILVAAVFKSASTYLDFITTRLSGIRGINGTHTYNFLKIYKRRHNILPMNIDVDSPDDDE